MDHRSLHMNAAVSVMLYFSRRCEEAIEYGRRTVELDEAFFQGYLF
jgi:hypothetical protein